MTKRVVLVTVAFLAIFAGIFGFWYVQGQKAQAAQAATPRPLTTITATIAAEQEWRTTLNAIGSLVSHAGITVRTEAEGQVARIAFSSGQEVQAGDLLIELESSVEQAQLAGLEATARLGEISLARARELREQNTNAEAELDAAEAECARAQAAVSQMRAVLQKRRIVAPFAGRLGITQVDPGQFLNKGDAVVLLEAVDPIHVDFSLAQQEIGRVRPGMTVRLAIDAFPDRAFAGTITAIHSRVNDSTRNVRVRATLANADELLRPGMFAAVQVELDEVRHVVVLPTSSIVYNPYGNGVFVLTEQKTEHGSQWIAREHFVELGATRGSQVSVLKGLNAGDQVVTSGQIKLRSGAAVQINNQVTPSADPAPQPAQG
jgi:membrane fusion protein (multidrug efflux system)